VKWFGPRKKANESGLPMLSTARLVLRTFDPSDAVDVYAYAQNPKVAAMAGFAPHTSLEESREMVRKFIQKGEIWAIVEKSTGRVIGTISLQADSKRPKMENARSMGYMLGEECWGQGYATEACREVLRYAFEELGCEVVSVNHFPTNQKSRRVIKKLGFTPEGTLRHAVRLPDETVTDVMTYSLLREEYEARKKNK